MRAVHPTKVQRLRTPICILTTLGAYNRHLPLVAYGKNARYQSEQLQTPEPPSMSEAVGVARRQRKAARDMAG